MYTLCMAVDQMIFLHFSDMIAASACDLLCNCFFGNTCISYKKIVQFHGHESKPANSNFSIFFYLINSKVIPFYTIC